jgi:pSer/pThr/pTyr-binding forkhead associated (FHA) protein
MAETRFILKQIPNGPETAIVGVTTVGRNEDNTLRLAETKVSRYHARLTVKETVVFVEDLGSSNGTFINDKRIEANKSVQLHAGDRLRFDRDEFEFRAPAQESNKTEMRPAAGPARPASWIEDPDGKHTVFIPPTPKKPAAAKAPGPGAAISQSPGHSPGDAPYLLISTGSNAGRKIEMPVTAAAKQTWTIGGQSDRNICLTEAGVSAIHATLRRDGSAWQLTDDLSVNGTFVNDTKILQCFLSDGDRLRFGPLECAFRIPPPAAKSSEGGRARLGKVALLVTAAFLVTLAAIFAAAKFWFK